ncbi:hypothetical protein WH47_02074 [Habropoda laboriosa]|uniref:Uncharacterized protein n=1 Tax=Habropoda laboriosa TaxID=597456 RepID=A0A0L7QJ21_9HYME|nr:hypothetical protein WH47_02074 [Habropoda laboriosa]
MDKAKGINRKGSRASTARVSRPRKRKRPQNPHEVEGKAASTSASARKLTGNSLEGQSAVLACTGESAFPWFPVDAVAVDVGVFARFDCQRNERAHPLKTLSGVAGFFHRPSRGCGWLVCRFLKLDRGNRHRLGTLSPY